MKVADVMVREVASVTPDTPVREVASLMLEKRISGVPVVDAMRRVVGIVSEGDFLRRPEIGTDHVPAGWLSLFLSDEERARGFVKSHGRMAREVMTQPAICVAPDAPLPEVVRLMERHRIKRLPVVERGKLAGIVTRIDLLRAVVSRPPESSAAVSDRELCERIDTLLRSEDWAEGAVVYVKAQSGVVQLWGTVESGAQRDALLLAVGGLPGVKDLQLHLGRSLAG